MIIKREPESSKLKNISTKFKSKFCLEVRFVNHRLELEMRKMKQVNLAETSNKSCFFENRPNIFTPFHALEIP